MVESDIEKEIAGLKEHLKTSKERNSKIKDFAHFTLMNKIIEIEVLKEEYKFSVAEHYPESKDMEIALKAGLEVFDECYSLLEEAYDELLKI